MPPVRDASTNPSAATVLPAPVACSNQKRLPAFGSSGCSASCASSSSRALFRPVLRLLVEVRVLVELVLARDPRRRELDRRPGAAVAVAVALPVARAGALGLGEQRGQRARERVDLVGGENGAVDERRLLHPEQALQPEQQRPRAPPRVGRQRVDAGLDLRERLVEGQAARAAGRERGGEVLAFEHEGLTRALLHPLEVV